ncbi:hypothetical protein P7B02_01325 [Caulobacter segnis]|jgi:hypothetical protein|uniref:hypothetical protein n=1 Tax=Caulobacter segnis TaxID=88688 RepID=UPI00241037DC|nr:hypothetical protein [Caulobacter segnis]MDG2520165.1 hypothetical protein [Caulobacter segnis]
MPLITRFARHDTPGVKRQKTQVVARHKSETRDGQALVQIDTYSADDKDFSGKPVQTFQLDRKSAFELWNILGKEFDFFR